MQTCVNSSHIAHVCKHQPNLALDEFILRTRDVNPTLVQYANAIQTICLQFIVKTILNIIYMYITMSFQKCGLYESYSSSQTNIPIKWTRPNTHVKFSAGKITNPFSSAFPVCE